MYNAKNGALATIGAIGLIVGLLGGFGVAPFAVTCTAGCNTGLVVNFGLTSSSTTVTFTDTSTLQPPASDPLVSSSSSVVAWGDGTSTTRSAASSGAFGLVLTHQYTSGGTYTIAETLSAVLCPTAACASNVLFVSSTGQTSITVTNIVTCTSSPTGPCSINGVTLRFTYTAVGLALTLNGVVTVSSNTVTITGQNVSWGDSQTTNEGTTLTYTTTHTYTTAGSYTIQISVTYVVKNGTQVVTIGSATFSVVPGLTTGGGTGISVSGVAIDFTPLTGILTFVFGGLLVMSLIPGIKDNPLALIVGEGVLAVVGLRVGFFV